MADTKSDIEAELARYEETLARYESGLATTGEVDGKGRMTDTTPELVARLKRAIADLRTRLANWLD